MFRSVLALTFRNFFRNLNYSVITLSGLVLGITTAILMFTFLYFEFSYDRQDPDASRVFTIMSHELYEGSINTNESTEVPLVDFLNHDVPEVEYMTRIDNELIQIKYNDVVVTKNSIYADSNYFKVFPTTILEGNPDKPLRGKTSVAISSELSKILFPNTNALGKFITIGKGQEFQVSAVYQAYSENNSMQYAKVVMPYQAKKRPEGDWENYFVKLIEPSNQTAVEEKLNQKLKEHYQDDHVKATLFCLTDWRLHWNFENGKVVGGRIVYVVSVGIIGLFILVMACVNYMNMATARATRRAREIGVRKMTGATKRMLMQQFITESILMSLIAALISMFCAELVLPLFQQLIDLTIEINWSDPTLILGLASITLLTGLLAGSYPAFLLSSFKPAAVLKGSLYTSLSGSGIRKGLVVFQFILSVILIFGALVMWQQTTFLLNKDVGYDKHNVINIWLSPNVPIQTFRDEVAKHSSVVSVAYGGASPMEVNGNAEVKWPGMPPSHILLYGATADFEMIPTLGMKLVQGRNFSKNLLSDSSNYIINESAAKLMGFQNPIGQRITYTMFGEREGEIIGVIKDFHNDDIHLPIAPVIFGVGRQRSEISNMFIRYQDGKLDEALEHLKKAYQKFELTALNYSLLDKDYEAQLYREIVFRRLSLVFTIIAIMIACLGLMGLALFNAERRTKEIGIRKVLGASVAQVIGLMYKEFMKPTLISLAIALPLAYYLMNTYLQNFAYRISLNALYFIITAGGLILLALWIVSAQSYKAAVRNPVDALKTE